MSNKAISLGVGILATVMVGWVLHVGASIIQPFVVAVLLCVLLRPVVDTLAKLYIPPAVTVVALVVLLFFGVAKVGVLVETNLRAFFDAEQLAEAETGLDPFQDEKAAELAQKGRWGQILAKLGVRVQAFDLPEDVQKAAQDMLDTLADYEITSIIPDAAGTGFDFIRVLVLILIYMLFIFAEQAVFRSKILAVAGDREAEAADALDSIARGIQRYLGVKTITSLATGVICYTALLMLEIPFAVLWGFLTFVLNYIPTFGSIIAGIFPTLTALAMGDGGDTAMQKAAIVVIVYLSVNLTLGSVIEPKILGRELNLSPLVIVVSVVVWAGLWGAVGTFLAVPIMATAQIIMANTEGTRPLAMLLSSGPPRERRPRLPRPREGAAA